MQGVEIPPHRKGGAEQKRAQRDHRPVKGNFGGNVPRLGYLENKVETVFDRRQQQNGGDGDTDDADGGQLAGVFDNGGKIAAYLLFKFRRQVLKDKLFHLAADGLKTRKGGKNRQPDGKQRHQCDQRSVGKRRSHPEDHVVLRPFGQKKQKVGQRFRFFRQLGFPFHKFAFIQKNVFTNQVKSYKKL